MKIKQSAALFCMTLFLATTLAQTAAHAAGKKEEAQQKPNSEKKGEQKEELGFVDAYFPFQMHETYSAQVDKIVIGVWVGAFFCPGIGVLVGNIMLGDEGPEESDAMMVGLAHMGLRVLCILLSIPTAGLTFLVTLADAVYLAPVAILNAYDRALIKEGKAKKPKPPKKDVFFPAPPPKTGRAIPVAMAY